MWLDKTGYSLSQDALYIIEGVLCTFSIIIKCNRLLVTCDHVSPLLEVV